MKEQDIIFYYKNLKSYTKRICTCYANSYKIEYTDLLSYADEIFLKSCYKYKYQKIEFQKFYRSALHQCLRKKINSDFLKLERRQKAFRELYLKQNDHYFIKVDFDKPKLSDFVVKVLDFCMKEDPIKKLEPYAATKNKKLKSNKIYKYSLEKYFKKVLNFSRKEIIQGEKEIKYLLQTNQI